MNDQTEQLAKLKKLAAALSARDIVHIIDAAEDSAAKAKAEAQQAILRLERWPEDEERASGSVTPCAVLIEREQGAIEQSRRIAEFLRVARALVVEGEAVNVARAMSSQFGRKK